MWINPEQISKKLSSISIEDIAKSNKFTCRYGGKITPLNFVLSFFISIQTNKHTLSSWTQKLSLLIKQTISYIGLKKAQNINRAYFAKELLESALSCQLKKGYGDKLKTRLLDSFTHVFIEDSTCISLPPYLYKYFPGAHSKTGKAATAKIQFRQELKSGTYTKMELKNFRNNDQSFAADILDTLQQGDLIIRDLGYSVLDVFERIINLKAFFISRLRYGMNLYDPLSGQQINLAKQLKKAARDKKAILDLFVLVGSKHKVPLRLCAIKCPPKVTRQKRKAARQNRHASANHSKDYIELLGWTIFITNVSKETLSAQDILQVYGYRWRIEIIFKCWKSHFKMDHLFDTQAKLTKQQVEITFYLFLTWLTLFFANTYNYYLHEVYTRKKKVLSILKFAKFVKEHFKELIYSPDSDFWIDHLAYYCTYTKRKDRLNFYEQVFLLI